LADPNVRQSQEALGEEALNISPLSSRALSKTDHGPSVLGVVKGGSTKNTSSGGVPLSADLGPDDITGAEGQDDMCALEVFVPLSQNEEIVSVDPGIIRRLSCRKLDGYGHLSSHFVR